jgi:hypothetical protein
MFKNLLNLFRKPIIDASKPISVKALCERGYHEYDKWEQSHSYFFQRRFCIHCNYCQEEKISTR